MKGWFDLFRSDGGPTLYHHSNRTSVTGDMASIVICLVFATILAGFLIIFPGVRSQRLTTFTCVILSIVTGATMLVSVLGSSWQTGHVRINTLYRAFAPNRIHADLGAHFGLNHVNITLTAVPSDALQGADIDFNERFQWLRPLQMQQEHRAALAKGLPYPILTVAEHLSINDEGFNWGAQYRRAGYYTSIIIWTAVASWLLMNLLLVNVPRYGAYLMTITGALMCLAAGVYHMLLPARPLHVHLEQAHLQLSLGWHFYMVLVVGVICTLFGLTATIADLMFPHTFSTILEVDFGTPYDRHILIVESDEMRKTRRPTLKIPKLEEPFSAGIEATSKLIRRLSKRGGGDCSGDAHGVISLHGLDNVAFELESKTPQSAVAGSHHRRTDSSKSNRSMNLLKRGVSGQRLDVPFTSTQTSLPATSVAGNHFQRADSRSSVTACGNSSVVTGGIDTDDDWSSEPAAGDSSHARRSSTNSVGSSSSTAELRPVYCGGGGGGGGSLSVPSLDSHDHAHPQQHRSHPMLEKKDSRSSNIIVFHTQDARGQLIRRQSTDPVPLDA